MSRLTIERLQFLDRGPIDLMIESTECVCISGPSGSGKTLMLRAIADLDPHEGCVYLDGREAGEYKAPDWRARVGLLPGESRWWFDSVRPHLLSPSVDSLNRLGFDGDILDWPVSRLSAGERQRIALIRLLCIRPEVLLLDEPTARLDPENARRIEQLVDEYRQQSGAAILWISHDPEQIKRICRRHYALEAGTLREERTP